MRRLLLLMLAGTVLLVSPAFAREWLAIGSGRTKGVGYGTCRTDMAFSVSCVAGSGRGRIANIDVGQLAGSRIPIRFSREIPRAPTTRCRVKRRAITPGREGSCLQSSCLSFFAQQAVFVFHDERADTEGITIGARQS